MPGETTTTSEMSTKSKLTPYRTSGRADLGQAQKVAVRVLEPGGPNVDTALHDSLDRLDAGQIEFLELDASLSERRHLLLDVPDLPAHLGMPTRAMAAGEDKELRF